MFSRRNVNFWEVCHVVLSSERQREAERGASANLRRIVFGGPGYNRHSRRRTMRRKSELVEGHREWFRVRIRSPGTPRRTLLSTNATCQLEKTENSAGRMLQGGDSARGPKPLVSNWRIAKATENLRNVGDSGHSYAERWCQQTARWRLGIQRVAPQKTKFPTTSPPATY